MRLCEVFNRKLKFIRSIQSFILSNALVCVYTRTKIVCFLYMELERFGCEAPEVVCILWVGC